MTVRTRFAPSPTGYLHVGGARTALYCYLYARKLDGKFVLRIEDTDRERSTPESLQAIIDGMAWLGLAEDEGPYFQTERFDRYEAVIRKLLDGGQAYRCNCSKERLDSIREAQMQAGGKPRYDGHCRSRNVSEDEPHVVRFLNPDSGQVLVEDLIRGPVMFDNNELDDLIIRRSDGTPTYNLTVVVDDLEMNISHVIRGDDHLNNTPRQINILRALGGEAPKYAHVPMILGDDGARLSKRHGAVSVLAYRDAGYLPEALLNYLVRLGWSHGDQELFSMDEMIELFDLADVNKAASAFNTEKLDWLNQHYIKAADGERLAELLGEQLARRGVDTDAGPDLVAVAEAQRERAKTMAEMAEISRCYFEDFEDYDAKGAKQHLRPVAEAPLQAARDGFAALEEWSGSGLLGVVEAVAAEQNLKLGKIAQPLRVATVGRAASPSIDITLALVGRERTLARIDRALDFVRARAAAQG